MFLGVLGYGCFFKMKFGIKIKKIYKNELRVILRLNFEGTPLGLSGVLRLGFLSLLPTGQELSFLLPMIFSLVRCAFGKCFCMDYCAPIDIQ